jgi:carbon monoxide dehydrogenase subunit G
MRKARRDAREPFCKGAWNMDLVGEYRLLAGRGVVWSALNDADVLRRCIPGCQSLEKLSDREMSATVVAKIGPVKATFKGAVTLENMVPPESYTIVGEGKGGVAGFAKGSADVSLAEDGDATVLSYSVKAQVGGKLAQLGSRLIVSTSRKMADEFFGKFKEIVEGDGAAPEADGAGGDASAASSSGAAASGGGEASSSSLSGVELDAGLAEAAKTQALSDAPHRVGEAVSEAVSGAVHEMEAEVESAAGRGFLGGPVVWGLAALGVVIVVLALMS